MDEGGNCLSDGLLLKKGLLKGRAIEERRTAEKEEQAAEEGRVTEKKGQAADEECTAEEADD